MSFGSTKSFFQGYMLEISSVVAVLTALGISIKMGASWPQFPFFTYIGVALVAALMSYTTAFAGMWAYLTTSTGSLNAALDEAGNLDTFTNLLSEPCSWGNRALVLTLVYFASGYWPAYASVSAVLQFTSLAAIITAFVAVARNLHILKLYLKHSVENAAKEEDFNRQLTAQILSRLAEEENEEEVP